MGDLLRAFTKTLAERHHAMVILDAPNSRAAEFREFWRAGQVPRDASCCVVAVLPACPVAVFLSACALL